jgi:hypothetical protein
MVSMSNAANIKALTRHLVERVKNAKTAAAICGVSEMSISRWGDDKENQFIPIDHLVDLDAAAGDLFLKEWARTRGYEMISIQNTADPKSPCVTDALGMLSKKAGELICTVLEAFADHQFTPAEKRRIRDYIAPIKDAIAQLEKAIS